MAATKKAIITIAGSVGAGKSSTADILAASLGYEHFSSGAMFRKIALEKGVSIGEINIVAETQKEIDERVDGWLQELYRTRERIVVDSRMAWHWMPESFKVFLELDHETAAQRIYDNIQKTGRMSEHASSVEEVLASIEARFKSEQKRYMTLYGVDPSDPYNYDLVLSTKDTDLERVSQRVLDAYRAWQEA